MQEKKNWKKKRNKKLKKKQKKLLKKKKTLATVKFLGVVVYYLININGQGTEKIEIDGYSTVWLQETRPIRPWIRHLLLE
jgi:hypothetical protein